MISATLPETKEIPDLVSIIPADRIRYLAEIVENARTYALATEEQSQLASQWYRLVGARDLGKKLGDEELTAKMEALAQEVESKLEPDSREKIKNWSALKLRYQQPTYQFSVRGKTIEQDLFVETLSHLRVPKVSLPTYQDWGDILRWQLYRKRTRRISLHGGRISPETGG